MDFAFGIRFPSEAHAMKVADVNLEKHVITITEPKKSGRRRRLLVEPSWLCCSQKHLSLANWFRWRDNLGTQTDALFPTPEGTAFPSKQAMSRFVVRNVTPRFPWLYPYLGRHWSVNARLIEWDHDYARVAAWHGHESVNMTKNAYEHSARLHESLRGASWLERASDDPRTAKSQALHRKTAVFGPFGAILAAAVSAPAGIRTRPLTPAHGSSARS